MKRVAILGLIAVPVLAYAMASSNPAAPVKDKPAISQPFVKQPKKVVYGKCIDDALIDAKIEMHIAAKIRDNNYTGTFSDITDDQAMPIAVRLCNVRSFDAAMRELER